MRMMATWPDPARLTGDEKKDWEWHHAAARARVTQWNAEIASLQAERATVPRLPRHQRIPTQVGIRLVMTKWGMRAFLRLGRALLWLTRTHLM